MNIFDFQQSDTIENDNSSDTVDVEITDPDDELLIFDADVMEQDILELTTAKSATKKRPRNRKQLLTKKDHIDEEDEYDDDSGEASTALESSAREVLDRFSNGCECQGSCFKDLNAESVYRHRLNIAELTKEEHHMYLMGVSMASLANPTTTSRHKERQRQRASYVYHGKRVCLDAFTYLENVTHYQLKRVRSHVMANGVVPRVHGNVRKKPHNTFSLDMYKYAENFLKTTLTQYTSDTSKHCFIVNESRTSIYEKFKQDIPPDGKVMGYTTFRHFLKKQFPHVRFSSRPSEAIGHRMGHTKDGTHKKPAMRTFGKANRLCATTESLATHTTPSTPMTMTAVTGAGDEEKGNHSAIDTETSFTEIDEDEDGDGRIYDGETIVLDVDVE